MEATPLLEKPLGAQQVQKNELPLSLRIKSSAMVQILLRCRHIRPLFVQAFELGTKCRMEEWIHLWSDGRALKSGPHVGSMLITVTRETRVILVVYSIVLNSLMHCCSEAHFHFIIDVDNAKTKCFWVFLLHFLTGLILNDIINHQPSPCFLLWIRLRGSCVCKGSLCYVM